MSFTGTAMLEISCLGLTQIYLSREKLEQIHKWFMPSLEGFEPVSVRDILGDGNLYLTDGHTRAFAAWKQGVKEIPCVYDNDEIVTCELGQIQYKTDITWCKRFGLSHIWDLENRILAPDAYEDLWRGRCGKLYDLEVALLAGTVNREQLTKLRQELYEKGLFVYGISEDLQIIYYENAKGKLFEQSFYP